MSEKLKRLLARATFMEEAGEGGDPGGGGEGGDSGGGEGGEGGGEGGTRTFTAEQIMASLPEDVRTEGKGVLENVKDLPDMAKQLIHAQKMIGGSVRIPQEDAPAETWNKFYAKLADVKGVVVNPGTEEGQAQFRKSLGVPEKSDEYKLDLSFVPEDVEIQQATLDQMRQQAHDLGLTGEQAQKFAESSIKAEMQQYQEFQERNASLEKEMRREFGDAYQDKVSAAKFAMDHVFGKEVADTIRNSPLVQNKDFIKGIARMGEMLADDGTISAARRPQMALTPEEAKEQIADIRADPGYWDKKAPNHSALVEKAQRLYASAYPEG